MRRCVRRLALFSFRNCPGFIDRPPYLNTAGVQHDRPWERFWCCRASALRAAAGGLAKANALPLPPFPAQTCAWPRALRSRRSGARRRAASRADEARAARGAARSGVAGGYRQFAVLWCNGSCKYVFAAPGNGAAPVITPRLQVEGSGAVQAPVCTGARALGTLCEFAPGLRSQRSDAAALPVRQKGPKDKKYSSPRSATRTHPAQRARTICAPTRACIQRRTCCPVRGSVWRDPRPLPWRRRRRLATAHLRQSAWCSWLQPPWSTSSAACCLRSGRPAARWRGSGRCARARATARGWGSRR